MGLQLVGNVASFKCEVCCFSQLRMFHLPKFMAWAKVYHALTDAHGTCGIRPVRGNQNINVEWIPLRGEDCHGGTTD